eukprot:227653_1
MNDCSFSNWESLFQYILDASSIRISLLGLIHWPSYLSDQYSMSLYCNNINNTEFYSPSKCRKLVWKAYEKIYENGQAKAIGVSNFAIKHLNDTFIWNNGIDEDDN